MAGTSGSLNFLLVVLPGENVIFTMTPNPNKRNGNYALFFFIKNEATFLHDKEYKQSFQT